MKIVLTVVAAVRVLLWLSLLPWLAVVAWCVLKGLGSSSTAIQEAAVAAVGCVAAFVPYAAARALSEVTAGISSAIREWKK